MDSLNLEIFEQYLWRVFVKHWKTIFASVFSIALVIGMFLGYAVNFVQNQSLNQRIKALEADVKDAKDFTEISENAWKGLLEMAKAQQNQQMIELLEQSLNEMRQKKNKGATK